MNISFTFRNFEPSVHLQQYARRRLEKIGRFLGKNADLNIQVIMALDRFMNCVDVKISGGGLQLSASEKSDNMYSAIDMVLDHIEPQVKKFVSRGKAELRRARRDTRHEFYGLETDSEDESDASIVVTDQEHFPAKPMDLDEAVMQLQKSHLTFLTFFNAETERVNVLYRRENGEFGLIDPIV